MENIGRTGVVVVVEGDEPGEPGCNYWAESSGKPLNKGARARKRLVSGSRMTLETEREARRE